MKKIAITGISGLIGSHLARGLLESTDCQVVGLSRHPLVPPLGLEGRYQHHAVDFATNGSVSPSFLEGVDAVVHLAQSEHYRDFPEHAESLFRINTLSTVHLLENAREAGVRKFVLASSGGVYGSGAHFKESDFISTRGRLNFYLNSKLCSELLAENFEPFLDVVALRFFFVYGPGQKKGMLIPRLVESVALGRPIQLAGADGLKINPVFVGDAVAAIRAALALPKGSSHKINVAGAEVLSMRRIGELIGEAVGKPPRFESPSSSSSGGPNEPGAEFIGDISQMSELLTRPKVPFAEGIRRYVAATPLPS